MMCLLVNFFLGGWVNVRFRVLFIVSLHIEGTPLSHNILHIFVASLYSCKSWGFEPNFILGLCPLPHMKAHSINLSVCWGVTNSLSGTARLFPEEFIPRQITTLWTASFYYYFEPKQSFLRCYDWSQISRRMFLTRSGGFKWEGLVPLNSRKHRSESGIFWKAGQSLFTLFFLWCIRVLSIVCRSRACRGGGGDTVRVQDVQGNQYSKHFYHWMVHILQPHHMQTCTSKYSILTTSSRRCQCWWFGPRAKSTQPPE